jgi:uncharacterized integral membrane protein (TIGR00697 family)
LGFVERRGFLLVLVGVYVAAEVVSNVTAGRLVQLGPLVVPGAIFLYSLTFTLRDAVHAAGGVAAARAAVWAGFWANLLLALYGIFVLALPAPAGFDGAPYRAVLGQSARVVAASLVAYLVAQLANTWVFERVAGGLWAKVTGSNAVAILLDTAIFIALAFAGTGAPLLSLMLGQVLFKFLFSLALLPFVYRVRRAVAGA